MLRKFVFVYRTQRDGDALLFATDTQKKTLDFSNAVQEPSGVYDGYVTLSVMPSTIK